MKLYLSLLVGLSAINAALGNEATCSGDAELVNQHQGQKYTQEIASQTNSETVRVLHPGDVATMDLRPGRLNVHVDENDAIQKATCG
ncbi:protein aeiA [Aspergillus ruber CBS 135680]|uniref:Elastase inhibitor n=1 Tax=Aspergillus ruber (strain CBS 135680) TaxID=1388766 RepID=A0A017S595_ASPRC|nr:elastase inhibitor [Aspergillus ruber CBS 135680]EYE92102.1 elastase inhibitor [Aspergillus ruber CBS 135680]